MILYAPSRKTVFYPARTLFLNVPSQEKERNMKPSAQSTRNAFKVFLNSLHFFHKVEVLLIRYRPRLHLKNCNGSHPLFWGGTSVWHYSFFAHPLIIERLEKWIAKWRNCWSVFYTAVTRVFSAVPLFLFFFMMTVYEPVSTFWGTERRNTRNASIPRAQRAKQGREQGNLPSLPYH